MLHRMNRIVVGGGGAKIVFCIHIYSCLWAIETNLPLLMHFILFIPLFCRCRLNRSFQGDNFSISLNLILSFLFFPLSFRLRIYKNHFFFSCFCQFSITLVVYPFYFAMVFMHRTMYKCISTVTVKFFWQKNKFKRDNLLGDGLLFVSVQCVAA